MTEKKEDKWLEESLTYVGVNTVVGVGLLALVPVFGPDAGIAWFCHLTQTIAGQGYK